MHVFLYEWVTGGGLVEETGSFPESLLAEGSAMLTALAEDFVSLDDCQVSVLRDIRIDDLRFPQCDVTEVHSRAHHEEEIARLAAGADHTILIAPELDGILEQTVSIASRAGGNLLGPSTDFVKLTADKHRTCQVCAEAGIRTPQAVLLAADAERLPTDFNYPGVLKPVLGAGSQHTFLVSSARDEPPPYPWPRRLEEYCVGMPVSVSFLCGPDHRVPLLPCRQKLSSDDRLRYLGGSLLLEEELAQRATELAEKVLATLPPALGYVGVDLVLGRAQDGSEDYFVEVNPRLTTSYVGLRAAAEGNIASALLANALGQVSSLNFRTEPLEFSADGMIQLSAGRK